jgi:hypothetical protein
MLNSEIYQQSEAENPSIKVSHPSQDAYLKSIRMFHWVYFTLKYPFKTFSDHRIAMAFSSIRPSRSVKLDGVSFENFKGNLKFIEQGIWVDDHDCVVKSYPDFWIVSHRYYWVHTSRYDKNGKHYSK